MVWILAQGIFESVAAPVWGAVSRALGEPVPLYPYSMLAGTTAACWMALRFQLEAPWALAGFPPGAWSPRALLLGFGSGAAALLLTSLLLFVPGALTFESVSVVDGIGMMDGWSDTALRVLVVLAPAALWEEVAFRGFLQGIVVEAMSAARSASLVGRAVASIGFGVVHLANPGAGVRTTVIVMLAGWCLSLLREQAGLPAAWAAHLAWNWIMAAVLHVAVSGLPFATPGYRGVLRGPDWLSGGGWGPEGGAAAALVLGGVALWGARESLRSSTSGSVRPA